MEIKQEDMKRSSDGSYYYVTATGHRRYFILKKCAKCNNLFLADKYNPRDYCSEQCSGRHRGRPIGHRLSPESIAKISEARTGQSQDEDVRKRISQSIKDHYEDYGVPDHLFSGKNHAKYIHGESFNHTTPRYHKWLNMRNRCTDPSNPNYKYYGARGIKVSPEWDDYNTFKAWLETNMWRPGLHIHRIDPNEDYSPDNCVLMTPSDHSKLHAIMRRP